MKNNIFLSLALLTVSSTSLTIESSTQDAVVAVLHQAQKPVRKNNELYQMLHDVRSLSDAGSAELGKIATHLDFWLAKFDQQSRLDTADSSEFFLWVCIFKVLKDKMWWWVAVEVKQQVEQLEQSLIAFQEHHMAFYLEAMKMYDIFIAKRTKHAVCLIPEINASQKAELNVIALYIIAVKMGKKESFKTIMQQLNLWLEDFDKNAQFTRTAISEFFLWMHIFMNLKRAVVDDISLAQQMTSFEQEKLMKFKDKHTELYLEAVGLYEKLSA